MAILRNDLRLTLASLKPLISYISWRNSRRKELINHNAPLRPLRHAPYLRRFIGPGGYLDT